MDDKIKLQIGLVTLEALFKYGIPATMKLLTTLNNKDTITEADIEALKGELDSASYFEK